MSDSAAATVGPSSSSSDVADLIRSMLRFTFDYRTNRCEIVEQTIRLDVTAADDVPVHGGGYAKRCCEGCTCGASADGYLSHIPTRFTLAAMTEAAGRKIATYTIEDARGDDSDYSAIEQADQSDLAADDDFHLIAPTETRHR